MVVDSKQDSSCFSAHLLNKSFPFLLDVLWTSGLLEFSRPVGRMLVPNLLDEVVVVCVLVIID